MAGDITPFGPHVRLIAKGKGKGGGGGGGGVRTREGFRVLVITFGGPRYPIIFMGSGGVGPSLDHGGSKTMWFATVSF